MKTEQVEINNNPRPNMATICLNSCRKLIERIAKAKEAVLNEFAVVLGRQHKMLELAINEAEALAWETEYPHLVFPVLAKEKAQEVATWEARQRAIRRPRWARRWEDNFARGLFTPVFSARP